MLHGSLDPRPWAGPSGRPFPPDPTHSEASRLGPRLAAAVALCPPCPQCIWPPTDAVPLALTQTTAGIFRPWPGSSEADQGPCVDRWMPGRASRLELRCPEPCPGSLACLPAPLSSFLLALSPRPPLPPSSFLSFLPTPLLYVSQADTPVPSLARRISSTAASSAAPVFLGSRLPPC